MSFYISHIGCNSVTRQKEIFAIFKLGSKIHTLSTIFTSISNETFVKLSGWDLLHFVTGDNVTNLTYV